MNFTRPCHIFWSPVCATWQLAAHGRPWELGSTGHLRAVHGRRGHENQEAPGTQGLSMVAEAVRIGKHWTPEGTRWWYWRSVGLQKQMGHPKIHMSYFIRTSWASERFCLVTFNPLNSMAFPSCCVLWLAYTSGDSKSVVTGGEELHQAGLAGFPHCQVGHYHPKVTLPQPWMPPFLISYHVIPHQILSPEYFNTGQKYKLTQQKYNDKNVGFNKRIKKLFF